MSNNANGQPIEKTLPLVAFDLDAVSRITGLSLSRLRRWDRAGFFQPAYADPNRRRPGSRIYSKDDVVALAVIAKLRACGVALHQITPMLPLLTPDGNGEWSAHTISIVGSRLFHTREDATKAGRLSGQNTEVKTIDLASTLAEVEEAIERLPERRPEEIGQVIRRRAIMQGVPIIAGTRIPTETIAWFHDHGYSLGDILENFPRLTPRDVEAAITFEDQQERKALAPTLAHARG